jgi:hypothetical protein
MSWATAGGGQLQAAPSSLGDAVRFGLSEGERWATRGRPDLQLAVYLVAAQVLLDLGLPRRLGAGLRLALERGGSRPHTCAQEPELEAALKGLLSALSESERKDR